MREAIESAAPRQRSEMVLMITAIANAYRLRPFRRRCATTRNVCATSRKTRVKTHVLPSPLSRSGLLLVQNVHSSRERGMTSASLIYIPLNAVLHPRPQDGLEVIMGLECESSDGHTRFELPLSRVGVTRS